MPYKLVKFKDNYADEFDVEGFRLFTDDSWRAFLDQLPQYPDETYFGTNEYIEYSTKASYLKTLEVLEISEKEYKILLKLFGTDIIPYGYGMFLVPMEEDYF